MAVDLAHYGIRVNAVAPGPVDTPLVQAIHTPQVRRAYMHHTPMRRYATADQIARAILFLLTARSRMTSPARSCRSMAALPARG